MADKWNISVKNVADKDLEMILDRLVEIGYEVDFDKVANTAKNVIPTPYQTHLNDMYGVIGRDCTHQDITEAFALSPAYSGFVLRFGD